MTGLLFDTGNSVVWGILQMIAGCLLAFPACRLARRLAPVLAGRAYAGYPVIIGSAFCGIALPLGIYGLIPVAALTARAKVKAFAVLPMLAANLVFNMLVPITETTFVWHSSTKRIIFAFVAGICIGVAAKLFNTDYGDIFSRRVNADGVSGHENTESIRTGYKSFLLGNINGLGIYLVIGALVHSFFYRYLYTDVMSAFYSNPLGASATRLLLGYDITSDYFLITALILNMFMDFLKLSALLFLLNIKGLLGYFAYFSIWAAAMTLITILGVGR